MKFSELQRLQRREGITVISSDARIEQLEARLCTITKERDALQARIEAMEKQEPAMWANSSNIISAKINKERRGAGDQHTCSETKTAYHDAPLYLAPGAQPAPSVPEGWKLVPTAESRHPGIYKMLGALHTVDNTPGASEWESYAAFLAAAPEAAP